MVFGAFAWSSETRLSAAKQPKPTCRSCSNYLCWCGAKAVLPQRHDAGYQVHPQIHAKRVSRVVRDLLLDLDVRSASGAEAQRRRLQQVQQPRQPGLQGRRWQYGLLSTAAPL